MSFDLYVHDTADRENITLPSWWTNFYRTFPSDIRTVRHEWTRFRDEKLLEHKATIKHIGSKTYLTFSDEHAALLFILKYS